MNRSPLWSSTCACAVLALVSLLAGCGGGGGGGNGGGKIAFTSLRDGNEEIYVHELGRERPDQAYEQCGHGLVARVQS